MILYVDVKKMMTENFDYGERNFSLELFLIDVDYGGWTEWMAGLIV